MSVQLDQATLDKLQALAQRRRVMLLLRGAFAAVLSLLSAMALVALVDRLIILSQPARIALSLAGYAAVMAVVYFTCLRHFLRIPTNQQLAKLVEDAEPGLREQVVSAVELAGDHPGAYDSEVFRAILQRNVGRRIQQVETQRILPWRLIAWWGGVCTFVAALTVVLLFVPGLRYGEMLTRAMLPTANTDRVSNIVITLVSPADPDANVPMNERVPVVVRIEGGTLDRVELDLETEALTKPERLAMAGDETPGQYRLDVPVTESPVRFRVVAGDGRSRYYTLSPQPRPRIVTFNQVIEHPAYTRREPTRISSDNGEISAIAGSVVALTLTADQPLERARLVLDLPGHPASPSQTLALTPDPGDPTRVTGTVVLDHSGTYRVELVARQTGFDNPDSPRYELTALRDELPSITMDAPTGMIGLPADALLRLLGQAHDDVGLDRVEREVRINGGAWSAEPIPQGPDGRIAQPVDLMRLDLAEGDLLELRLSATDLAGHTAHSASAQLIVTPDGIRAIDLAHANDTAALLIAMQRLERAARTQAERYARVRDANTENAIESRQLATQAIAARDASSDAITRARTALDAALASAPAGRASEEIVRAGRLLARIDAQQVLVPTQAVAPEVYAQAAALSERHAGYASAAAAGLTPMLAAEQSQAALGRLFALGEDLSRMARDAELDRTVREDLAWQRLQRRLALNGRQTESAAGLLAGAGRLSEDQLRAAATNTADDLRDQGARLREQAEAAEPSAALLHLIAPQRDRLAGTTRQVGGLTNHAIRSETEHDQRRGLNATGERMDTEELLRFRDTLTQRDGDDAARANRWDAATSIIRERARIEESRSQPDRAFLTDTTRTVAALSRLAREDAVSEVTPPALERVITAYDLIERAHGLEQLRLGVVYLAGLERGDGEPVAFTTVHSRDWQAIERRLEVVAERLSQRDEMRPASDRVRQARHSGEADQLRREMQQRVDHYRRPEPKSEELDAIARMLVEAQAMLAEPLARARQDLVDQSQSLPERLRELAEEQDQVREQTEQAAERAAQQPTAENRERAEELAQQQARFQDRLGDAVDALRRQADREDLLTQEGRERARDVDDAIAMLKPDVAETRQRLDDAQEEARADRQQAALQHAAEAQEQTAQTLRELADHFENIERGDEIAENQGRDELRSNERELGVDQQLDEQFEQMERLAELAQTDDQQRLAELEEQLRQDPAMQRELDRIADEATREAQDQLSEARAQERGVAEALEEQEQARRSDQNGTEERLARLADEARELERDTIRPLDRQAERGAQEARDEVRRAQESLREAAEQGQPNEQSQREEGRREEQAQRAEALAEQTADAAEELEAAEEEARAAEQGAEQRRQEARAEADRANERGQPDEQAARRAVEAAQERDQARQTREQAERAAEQARELADEAQAVAESTRSQDAQAQQQREQAAQQQQPIGEQVAEAAEDIERAARHEQRLGNEAQQGRLEEAAESTRALSEEGLPEAAEQIEGSPSNEAAAVQSRAAEEQIAQQQQQLAQAQRGQASQPQPGEGQEGQPQQGQPQAGQPQQGESQEGQPGEGQPQPGQPGEGQQPGQPQDRQPGQPGSQQPGEPGAPQPGQPGQPGRPQPGQPGADQPSSPEVAQALAQELDALDQQLNQGAPGRQPGGRAIDQAAQQQQQQMRQQRSQQAQSLRPGRPGQQPGQAQGEQPGNESSGPSEGGGMANEQRENGELPEAARGEGTWGDLPERMTDDLSHGARERAPAEYLDQVDAYFRAIAERARQAEQDAPEE